MKNKHLPIPLSRIEAFSDGVIAIIITLMILEIKIPAIDTTATSAEIWSKVYAMLNPFIAYLLSFVMVGVLWVNHHQFLRQLKHADRNLLWYNLHLLFWMSLLPIPTNFLGQDFKRPEITALYGFAMFMCAFAFTLMREYVNRHHYLFIDNLSIELRKKARVKLITSAALYFISIFAGYISVYISLGIFVLIPAFYFLPTNIIVSENLDK
ncbi:MAG TPA: TMEM175 family protein [Bacteroidia bacterium]|jgi:uncharacterized membrane protein|nr:TMEM175 family protein [Bacteroidia bacterium]